MFINILLIGVLTVAAVTDLKYHRIHNILTLPAVLLGFFANFLLYGLPGISKSALGFAVGFGLFFLIYLMGGMGGGDVKLIGAIGAIKGFPFVLWAICYSAFVGGMIAIAIMIWRGILWQTVKSLFRFLYTCIVPWYKVEFPDKNRSVKIPYGFAISLGTFWAMLLTL